MSGITAAFDALARHRVLERTTLVYISLPFLAFAMGWLRPAVALPVVTITLAGLYRASRHESDANGRELETDAWAIAAFVLAAAAVVFVVAYSGTGGHAFQFGGHYRNNSFIKDLMQYPWPLAFDDVGSGREPGVLSFYIANAILPALVGRIAGWAAAFQFQFAWTCIGVFLAVCWFMRVIGSRAPQFVLLFLCFGGLDLIGFWVTLGAYADFGVALDMWTVELSRQTPEMGGMFWLFPSTLTLLYHSPHHVLCSWIVMLVVLDDAIHRNTCRRIGLLVSFALLWSAFSFVGMAPFVLASLYVARGREMFSFENLGAGVVVLGTTALYIGSNGGEFLHGPFWQFQDLRETVWLLLLVCFVEFGVYALLLHRSEDRREGLAHPIWRWTAIATLLLVPWYRVGDFSDFTTKASVPAILVLQLCIARVFVAGDWRRTAPKLALIAALVIGSASACTMVYRSVAIGLLDSPPALAAVRPTNEIERSDRGGQLFSDGKGFFWKYIAAEIEYQKAEPVPADGVSQ